MPDNDRVLTFSTRRIEPRRLVPSKLRDARVAKRMSQTDLAERIHVTRQAVSAYEQGEKSPDPDTLTSISAVLEQPLAFFLTPDLPVFGQQSVRFFRAVGPKTKKRNLSCDVLGKWLAQAARYLNEFVNFPAVSVPAVSPSSPDGRYTDEEIEAAAEACRKAWGLGLGPLSNVVALLENNGVIVCRYKIPEDTVEAFSFWSGDRPFVFLASAKESACRSRLDAAHELGHLVLHRWVSPEELEEPATLALIESEAARFGAAFLAPRRSFSTEIYTTRLDAFVPLKMRWKVSIKAMVYRCKTLGLFDDDQATNLYKQISARRWNTREPKDDLDVIPFEQPRLLQRSAELLLQRSVKTPDNIGHELALQRSDIEQLFNLPSGTLSPRQPIGEVTPSLRSLK